MPIITPPEPYKANLNQIDQQTQQEAAYVQSQNQNQQQSQPLTSFSQTYRGFSFRPNPTYVHNGVVQRDATYLIYYNGSPIDNATWTDVGSAQKHIEQFMQEHSLQAIETENAYRVQRIQEQERLKANFGGVRTDLMNVPVGGRVPIGSPTQTELKKAYIERSNANNPNAPTWESPQAFEKAARNYQDIPGIKMPQSIYVVDDTKKELLLSQNIPTFEQISGFKAPDLQKYMQPTPETPMGVNQRIMSGFQRGENILANVRANGSIFTQFNVGVGESILGLGKLGYATAYGTYELTHSEKARQEFMRKLPHIPEVAIMSIPNLFTSGYQTLTENGLSMGIPRLSGQFIGTTLVFGAASKLSRSEIPIEIKTSSEFKILGTTFEKRTTPLDIIRPSKPSVFSETIESPKETTMPKPQPTTSEFGKQELPSLKIDESIKGLSPDTFLRETLTITKNPISTKSPYPEFRNPFLSEPKMPGSRLLGGQSGLGNTPKMPYERMAEEFLPQSKKEMFKSQETKTFLTGKSIPKASRGEAFKELDKIWKERETKLSEESKSGFTKTKQGQIVLQKQIQIQKEIQAQKPIEEQKTVQLIKQTPKEKQIQKQALVLYIPQATRLQQQEKTRVLSKQLTYTSPVQRIQESTAQHAGSIIAQLSKSLQQQSTRQISGQASNQLIIQMPKQISSQESKQLSKEMQLPKTIQKQQTISQELVSMRPKFPNLLDVNKFKRIGNSKLGKFPELSPVASPRQVLGKLPKFKIPKRFKL